MNLIQGLMHTLLLMHAADVQTTLPEKSDSSTFLPENWYCERHNCEHHITQF